MRKANELIINSTRRLTLIALMSTTLIGGKFALAVIPNVEIVTTLLIVYAVVFGFDALAASTIFCILDIFIYPPSLDVIISYFIYWNALALTAAIMRKCGVKKFLPYFFMSLLFTFGFGWLTSFFAHLMFKFPFLPYWAAGIPFYAMHIASSFAFMLVGFKPLTKLLTKLNIQYIRKTTVGEPTLYQK